MDPKMFVTRLDIEATGLLNAARLGLLSKVDEERTVHAELYKLNVCGQCDVYCVNRACTHTRSRPIGEGTFFKPHKDTPRSQSMFGSLVIVFPTPHEGGALILRHEDEEFTFDAAQLLHGHTKSIAYIAFFSDVEHEVTPAVSGHRITLTYNLYFRARRNTTSPNSLEVLRPAYGRVPAVRDALYTLLDDPTFMPNGGTLGFGFRRHYPFPENWTENMEDPLVSLERWLKGRDAALFQACSELGLSPELRLVSEGLEGEIMVRYMVELGSHVEDAESKLFDDADGVLVRSFVFTGDAADP